MKLIGNLIWLICGGILMSLAWIIIGCLYCITIIGIPFGIQAFKIAGLTLAPFGKKITRTRSGAGKLIGNIIWIIFGGLELAIAHFILGIIFYITIIGIPFGKQQFKLGELSLAPFGVKITN